MLHGALGEAFPSRVLAFASTAKSIDLRGGVRVEARGLTDLPGAATDGMLLLHLAYLTREAAQVLGIDRYVAANIEITATVLEAMLRSQIAGVFYASSGAVYGQDGRLETDLLGNPYGTLKHLDELALGAACGRLSARFAVARIFALSGAYMTKPAQFALGDLLKQGIDGGPLKVRAPRRVIRSYAAPRDILSVAFAHLLELEPSAPVLTFDAAGTTVEIGDLAARMASRFGANVSRAPISEPDDRYVGDGEPFASLLRALGVTARSLDQQIADTEAWLRVVSPTRPSTVDPASPTVR